MILVTGGNGFLGKRLIAAFKDNFRKARDTGTPQPKHGWRFGVFDYPAHTIIWPDPLHPIASQNSEGKGLDDLNNWVQRADIVIHTAAIANLYDVAVDPNWAWRVNVEGSRNVAEACFRHGKPLIHISTCCVYGNACYLRYGVELVLADENTTPFPTEIYASQKLESEDAVLSANPKTVIARLGTFYGPGMRDALFNARALQCVHFGKTIYIFGNGEQKRRYIYVDDVVSGIIRLMEPDAFSAHSPAIYNICGDEEVSVNETVDLASEIVGKDVLVEYVPPRPCGDIETQYISNERLKSLGWSPKVGYEEGMKRTWEWMRGTFA